MRSYTVKENRISSAVGENLRYRQTLSDLVTVIKGLSKAIPSLMTNTQTEFIFINAFIVLSESGGYKPNKQTYYSLGRAHFLFG